MWSKSTSQSNSSRQEEEEIEGKFAMLLWNQVVQWLLSNQASESVAQ